MGTNKNVFDAELLAITKALKVILRGGRTTRGRASQEAALLLTKIHILMSSQVTIVRLQHPTPGLEHWLPQLFIVRPQRPADREMEVEVHCVLGHIGGQGNTQGDKTVKAAAEGIGARRCIERFSLLAHINQTIMEKKCKDVKH